MISSIILCQHLRKKSNIFIVNLAFADLFICVITQPFAVVGLILGYDWFASRQVLCKWIASSCLIVCSCSMWNIAAIAINRFVCITYHKVYLSWYTLRRTILYALIPWIICMLLEMPNYIGWGGHGFDHKAMMCIYGRTTYSFTLFFVLVVILPPLLAVCFCYIRIFLYVLRIRTELDKFKEASSSTDRKKNPLSASEILLARSLFVVFATFLICWGPYASLSLVDVDDRYPKIAYVVAVQMAHLNSSLNALIYGATNKNFRQGYKQVLCKIFQRPIEETSHSVSNNSITNVSRI